MKVLTIKFDWTDELSDAEFEEISPRYCTNCDRYIADLPCPSCGDV